MIRIVGNERILTPVENTWDSFFLGEAQASEDFLIERATQHQPKRESF